MELKEIRHQIWTDRHQIAQLELILNDCLSNLHTDNILKVLSQHFGGRDSAIFKLLEAVKLFRG